MRQSLKPHPDSHCLAVTQLDVDVSCSSPGNLALRYFVTGKMNDLILPLAGVVNRGNELWRHTCFEAFIRACPGAAYYEFNFAPSRKWAAYGFDDYRSGMRIANEFKMPQIEVCVNETSCEVKIQLDLQELSNQPDNAPWKIGLSAVIEEASGAKSYWALAHPPGQPDFHHSDCFTLQIPPALLS